MKKTKLKPLNKNGFTVIELIVIMAVMALLVLIGSLSYKGYTKHARFVRLCEDAKVIEDASQRYFINSGDYPRLSNTPYTKAQVNSFSPVIYEKKGSEVTLEDAGSYYDVDFEKLKTYCKINDDYKNFILQNPVGDVYIVSPTRVSVSSVEAPIITVDTSSNPPTYTVKKSDGSTPSNIEYRLDSGTILNSAPTAVLADGDHKIEARIIENSITSSWASANFSISGGIKQVIALDSTTAALKSDGNLYVWGSNYYGEVGNNTTTRVTSPYLALTNVRSVSAGNGEIVLAIRNDGSLWGMGNNTAGMLGVTGATKILTPTKIMDNVSFVESATNYTAAITESGSLYMWGNNYKGQLGTGSFQTGLPLNSTPIHIMDDVAAVNLSYTNTTMAIKKDGSLWGWGYNNYGEVGVGTSGSTANICTPTKIMDNVKQVKSGYYYTMALKNDGTVWSWGMNGNGRLGDGTTANKSIPTYVGDSFASIATTKDGSVSAGIKTDGSLYVWGDNSNGAMGNGSYDNVLSPYMVTSNVQSVTPTDYNVFAIKNDNTLWGWGYNADYELGNGTTDNKLTPVKLLDGVRRVGCASDHSLAVKTSGSLWAWGYNSGTLGTGDMNDAMIPVQISLN